MPDEFYPKTKVKGVPITTPSMLGALNMEHNTGTQVTRIAKVEQNTKHKARPSTFYQVYMRIKLNSNNIVIAKKHPCWHMETTAPATSNAIRRAEQAVT